MLWGKWGCFSSRETEKVIRDVVRTHESKYKENLKENTIEAADRYVDTPHKTCSCNGNKRYFYKALIRRWWGDEYAWVPSFTIVI